MNSKKGHVFIISGPSGCGKSTVLAEVMAGRDNVYFSVSATTRKPRPGEADGVNYLFIEKNDFLRMIENDELLEYAEYVGNYYGTPAKPVADHVEAGDDVLLDIEVQGARQVMEKLPDAISIFIAPPGIEELERRLRGRSSENEEKIRGRLQKAAEEMTLTHMYDYVVVNDVVSRTAAEITDIINKAKKERTDVL